MNPRRGFKSIERRPVRLRMPADLRIRTDPQAQNRALSLKDFAQELGDFKCAMARNLRIPVPGNAGRIRPWVSAVPQGAPALLHGSTDNVLRLPQARGFNRFPQSPTQGAHVAALLVPSDLLLWV